MASWESGVVKAQLRLTSQRLGQLQEKNDSQAQITRTDIATLLRRGDIQLARAKAQKLILDDNAGDMLMVLEMHVGIILEHFNEIDKIASPSPAVVEAASSIIYAAPQTESKDLNAVRDLLIHRLGPDFAHSAINNSGNSVSPRVVAALSAPPPTASKLNTILKTIAITSGVHWAPEIDGQDILNAISEMLDLTSSPIVDVPRLRKLCSRGLPGDPPWLRPRVWKLLFGILPPLKSSWQHEIQKQRDSYYDLVRRLLSPLSSHPSPRTPLASADALLLSVFQLLERVPSNLFSGLKGEPGSWNLNPLDDSSPDNIRIVCASNLDSRLTVIQGHELENRLEPDLIDTPKISITAPEPLSDPPTNSYPSRGNDVENANRKHSSALLRLLYVHFCLNPGNQSPHLPSLLVPLYSVLIQESNPQDLAHVEADTFWLFEAIIGEFAELEDEDGGNLWMRKLGERLAWADAELSANLLAKGLDPTLPHYSYRWMAPLLTQTLPQSSALLVWDVLFSCPMRSRDANPKLDHLLDICTSMLIQARAVLFRLGKAKLKSPVLWAGENAVPPPSPIRPWELENAFLEGMTLLQRYPLEAAGGIDRILQTAADLASRREQESNLPKVESLTLGARLKVTMWKGFTNQAATEDEENDSDIESDHGGNDTETPISPKGTGITSRFATTVWRGITNQSSMDDPPSPMSLSRSPSPVSLQQSSTTSSASVYINESPTPSHQPSASLAGPSRIWGYAEKLKDSDTAATLAKVSSNWRAMAMAGSWGLGGSVSKSAPASPPSPPKPVRASSSTTDNFRFGHPRKSSLPSADRSNVYSPPVRPTYFRPPRDSMMPQPRKETWMSSPPGSPELSPQSEAGLAQKTRSLTASLSSLTGAQTPVSRTPKTGPRPLLLNSSSLLTSQQPPSTMRSATNTPTPLQGQWSDVFRMKGHLDRHNSNSSVSSLSAPDAIGRSSWKPGNATDRDSDSGSRVVPLNRRSVSPMAPRFISPRGRSGSISSGMTSDGGMLSPPFLGSRIRDTSTPSVGTRDYESRPDNAWSRSYNAQSSISLTSPPAPATPITTPEYESVRIRSDEYQVVLRESNVTLPEPLPQARKLTRKRTPSINTLQTDDTSDSTPEMVSKAGRVRSKQHSQRPANLHIQENIGVPGEQKESSPRTLAVQWPSEHESATPKVANFNGEISSLSSPISPRSPRRLRKVSTDAQEGRLRKGSGDGADRTRKVSAGTYAAKRKVRESAGIDGDDEGYDDLLSAYESEAGDAKSLR